MLTREGVLTQGVEQDHTGAGLRNFLHTIPLTRGGGRLAISGGDSEVIAWSGQGGRVWAIEKSAANRATLPGRPIAK